MNTMTVTDRLIQDYLDHLERAARTLPAAHRAEILAEIKEHISITLAQSEDQSEATVRSILTRLGTPEDIVREAESGLPAAPARRRVGAFEIVTVVLLLVGGIVIPLIGWVIGAVLLWASARWTIRDKVIGTLVVPGGLGLAVWLTLFASSTSVCTADGNCDTSGPPVGVGIALVLIGTIGPLASAAYLLRRAGRATA
jgi:uncharacterized membrane protein